MRDVDVIGIVSEKPGPLPNQPAIGVPSGGTNWPRLAISARRLDVSSRCRCAISRWAHAIRTAVSGGGICSNAEIAGHVP